MTSNANVAPQITVSMRIFLFKSSTQRAETLKEELRPKKEVAKSETDSPAQSGNVSANSKTDGLILQKLDNAPEDLELEFYFRSKDTNPRWHDLVLAGISDSRRRQSLQRELAGATVGGVLLARAGRREWAITFGSGHHFIDHDKIVHDFGRKVVLNCVRPDSIRALDFHTFYGQVKLTKQQISKGQRIRAYDLDITENILKSIAGETEARFASTLGSILAGGESLLLTRTVSLKDLAAILQELLRAYDSDRYVSEDERRELGEIAQNIYEIQDTTTNESLTEQFLAQLRSGNLTNMELAYQDMVVWGNAQISLDEDTPDSSLTLPEIQASLPKDFTLDTLKRKRLYEHRNGKVAASWPIAKCIAYTLEDKAGCYSFIFGRWYRVEALLVERLREFARGLLEKSLKFGVCNFDEVEGDYARRICKNSRAMLCLDKRHISLEGEADKSFEPCDIFIPKSKRTKSCFVHIKKTSKTDDHNPNHEKFSHLFVQGLNSLESVLQDKKYQKDLRKKLFAWRTDLDESKPRGSFVAVDCKVVYLVAMKGDCLDRLPAFSLLTLRSCVVKIRRLGAEASIYTIDMA